MRPVIALVGRPNVGKSTLFNRLTHTRQALVADEPGLTRDRKYGTAVLDDHPVLLIDTGGLSGTTDGLDGLMASQTLQAVGEADLVLFMVDARQGLTAADEQVAAALRQMGKHVLLVLNKTDGVDSDIAASEFHGLGLGAPVAISAAHGRGMAQLREAVAASLALETPPAADAASGEEQHPGINIAVVGRPNVGKSTLVNRILGEERVVVFDMPGTTRDSIYIPFERRGINYTLIDTAGVRRRRKVTEAVEKFSVIKSLQSVADADVVILVLDARQEIAEQDLHLLGFVLEAGKALVVAVNKWDGLDAEVRDRIREQIDRRLGFAGFADIHYISALHGSGVGTLFDSVRAAYDSAGIKLSTPRLTALLEQAVQAHAPPLVRGRRIKLRYAHQGGQRPPVIVIHGNQTDAVPASYKRYLNNHFRKALALVGTPLRIEFKGSVNPYEGKRNLLTPRQERRRKRLKKFVVKRGR